MSIESRDEFEKWFLTEHCAENETVDFCKNGLMREAWYVAWVKALAWQASRPSRRASDGHNC